MFSATRAAAVTWVGMSPESSPEPAVRKGLVALAEGSPDADARIARVLWNDPASGLMRHADAGYDLAIDCAKRNDLWLPSLKPSRDLGRGGSRNEASWTGEAPTSESRESAWMVGRRPGGVRGEDRCDAGSIVHETGWLVCAPRVTLRP